MPNQATLEAEAAAPLTLDIQGIRRLLPHRYPMLLVDRVTHLEPGRYAEGLKCVTANEPYLVGHFPEYPIMPGVLIVDAMAQLAGIMMRARGINQPSALNPEEAQGERPGVLAAIRKMRFHRTVLPGDRLELQVRLMKSLGSTHQVNGVARVDGHKVTTGELVLSS